MKNRKIIAIVLAILSIVLMIGAIIPPAVRERIAIYAREDSWIANGVDIIFYTGNLTGESMRLDGANGAMKIAAPTAVGTATPIINIENDSVADSIVSRNAAGTPTWTLDKSGNVTQSGSTTGGAYDLNGAALTWDADADTISVASFDDVITTTLGAATGRLSILTGNLRVGNGSPTQTQNGEDAYVESIFEVDGATYLDGGLFLDSNKFTVADISGNTVISGTLTVTSTSNFLGNVADSGGDFTIADTLDVTGNVDLDALFVPGFADETITDGETLTPTVTVYALDSAGAVTFTLAASATEGQFLTLIGDDDNNVVVADTNLRATGGVTVSIRQHDVATFIFQDSEWLLLSKTVND